jgi:osmoprotectant transport system ATP-binding protein
MSEAKCETGWGEGLSSSAVPALRDHLTPLRMRFAYA